MIVDPATLLDAAATPITDQRLRDQLLKVATYNQPVLNQSQVAQLVDGPQLLKSLSRTLQASDSRHSLHNSEQCQAVQSAVLKQLSIRLRQIEVGKALQAHWIIHSTYLLANQTLIIQEELQNFVEKQKIARENGIAVADPFIIARTSLQIDDKAVQIVTANQTARSQLVLLCDDAVLCGYSPEVMMQCDWPAMQSTSLCDLVVSAQRHRGDAKALEILRNSLCDDSLDCYEDLLLNSQSAFGVPLPHAKVKRALFGIFGRAKREAQAQMLRASLTVALDQLREKIASDVTQAWYQMDQAHARLMIADEALELANRRVEQLEAFADEMVPPLKDRLDAKVQSHQNKIDRLTRLQECQLANVNLRLAIGSLD